MPPKNTHGKTHQKLVKLSQLLDFQEFKLLERDEQAAITHYLQSPDAKTRTKFLKSVDKIIPKFPIELRKTIRSRSVINDLPIPPAPLKKTDRVRQHQFKFIDLFAGIGGMRIAFQNLGGTCVFSSEWDSKAQDTYLKNYGEMPFGDITKIKDPGIIPDHKILVAGFPCQAFSIAGHRGGFNDTRGTLFHDVARILKKKQPDAFLLENVKGLLGHDKRQTIKIILQVLRDDLKYFVPDPQVINARHFGLPQNRERVFIVGFKDKAAFERFKYPEKLKSKPTIRQILEKEKVAAKYYISLQYLNTLKRHLARHQAKGHGFGYQIIDNDGVANAIVVGGMGRERNLIIDKRQKNLKPTTNIKGPINSDGIRRMTPREWARLQGFPEKFKVADSDAQAYRQFGNSVAIPAIEHTGHMILKALQLQ